MVAPDTGVGGDRTDPETGNGHHAVSAAGGHAIGVVVGHNRDPWACCCHGAGEFTPVLPPTVVGFYLLLWMGPSGWLGQLTQAIGLGLWTFNFTGLLVGSMIVSLPFAVQPIQHAFVAIGRRPIEVAATLRASPWDAFFTIVLPQARAGLLTAAILSFAHTVGEFGVVLMIGGNIAGQTRVVSTQIYGMVEAMEYAPAHALAALMVVFSFLVLLFLSRLSRRSNRGAP